MDVELYQKNIELEVKKINKYINEYGDNIHDIFFELEKLGSYWNDKDYTMFEETLRLDKENNFLLLNQMQEVSDFL